MGVWYPLVLVILFTIVIYALQTGRRSRNRALNLPPGSYGWPVLGESLELFGAGMDGVPERFVKSRMEKYNSAVFKTSLLGEKMIMLCGAAGNKFLFSNENKLVTVWWPASVRKLLGPCLATIPGEEGKQMRKLMSCFMNPEKFTRFYVTTMDLVTQLHIKKHWEGKDEVVMFPAAKMYTFELACRLFMYMEDPEQISKLGDLFQTFLKGVISLPFNFPGTRFYNATKAAFLIRKQLASIIRERKAALEQQQSVAAAPQDFLTHLLVTPDETGKFMPESIIINNMVLLLFAGHDTSSSAITMMMKYLAKLPEVYEGVLKEQLEIVRAKGADEYLQWDDIQKMRYSWNVVSEVIRLAPPVTGAFRQTLADITFAGYNIPKGWKVYWSATSTHRDPALFGECNKFDPSRYEGSGPVPFSYVAFGGGPRMCLGKEFARLEILIFLHNIIRRFRWKLKLPDEKVVYDPMPTPVEGLPLLLQLH